MPLIRSSTAASILLFILLAPVEGYGYYIAVKQLQPEKPYPGDTVVFKVTLVNEASWKDALNVEAVSPDGIVYPLGTIRYRAGNYLPSTAYVSFDIPEDAISGNYTLSLRSHDYIYNEANFYVFEKEVTGFFINTSFSNNTLRVAFSSSQVIRGLGVELLNQLQSQVEAEDGASTVTFFPVKFRPIGQSYHFLGDVKKAEVGFSLIPRDTYIVVPIKITWDGGEKVVTWSGMAQLDPDQKSVPIAEVSMEAEAGAEAGGDAGARAGPGAGARAGADAGGAPIKEDRDLKKFLLPAALFSLILPSVFLGFNRVRKGIAARILGNRRKPKIFDGGKKEVGEKWDWVEWCVEDIRHSCDHGTVRMAGLRSLLRRKLDSRETSLAVAYLLDRGVIIGVKERCRLAKDWRKRLR